MSWGHPVAGINIWSPELRRDDKAVPSNRSTGFWLVSRTSPRPQPANAPPSLSDLRSISRQAGRLFHHTIHRPHPWIGRQGEGERVVASLVAVLPSRGSLSISSDEALRTRSYIHAPGGTDDHFMKPPRVRWRQEATPDNETGTCTRPCNTLSSFSFFLEKRKKKLSKFWITDCYRGENWMGSKGILNLLIGTIFVWNYDICIGKKGKEGRRMNNWINF